MSLDTKVKQYEAQLEVCNTKYTRERDVSSVLNRYVKPREPNVLVRLKVSCACKIALLQSANSKICMLYALVLRALYSHLCIKVYATNLRWKLTIKSRNNFVRNTYFLILFRYQQQAASSPVMAQFLSLTFERNRIKQVSHIVGMFTEQLNILFQFSLIQVDQI